MARKPSKRSGAAMTPTARARIEQAVERAEFTDFDGLKAVLSPSAIRLILAERARLKRGVKKLRKKTMAWKPVGDEQIAEHIGYIGAIHDILALWEK